MFSLLTHCSVCQSDGTKQETMYKVSKKDEQVLNKLIACSFDIDWLDTDTTISICNACYIRLQIAIDFIEMCHTNCVVLKGYVVQLNHTTDTRIDDQNVAESVSDSEVILVKEESTNKGISEKKKETENVNIELSVKLQNENEQLSQINTTLNEEDNENDAEINKETKIDIDEIDITFKADPECETESFANIDKKKSNKFEHNLGTNFHKMLTKNANTETEAVDLIDEEMHSIEMVLLEEEPTENLSFLQEEEQFNVEDHLLSNIDVNLVIEQQSEICSEDNVDDTAVGRNRFKCSICKKKVISKSKLRVHMRTHTGEKPFVCRFCDKRYSRAGGLNQHILTIHSIKPYKCTKCGDSFMFRKNLIEHLLSHGHGPAQRKITHTGERTDVFKCSTCNEEFATDLRFKQHMLLLHVNKDTRKCELCNKKFPRDICLERHLMLHTGEVPPHACSLCSEKFLLRHQLREHMAKHKGIEYNCLLCGKMFTAKANLNRHMKLHSQGKSFECKICQKCFSSAEYLRNHQSVHNGETPYECTICHKKFALRQTMNHHKLSHYND